MSRSTRVQLGMSPSEFKTMLKLRGHKVDRDCFKYSPQTVYRNRLYRWRHWSTDGFFVDISCKLSEFDRWANSTDQTITFVEWKMGPDLKDKNT